MRWLLVLLLCVVANAQEQLTFQGRLVSVTAPKMLTPDTPAGAAAVCLEGPPRRDCHWANGSAGRSPAVKVVQYKPDESALFFSAWNARDDGNSLYVALLRPSRNGLHNLFAQVPNNFGRYAFWSEPSVSTSAIFVTANYVWGPREAHADPHRYIISAYVLPAEESEFPVYALDDSYMTLRVYENADDILAAERDEILARLHRIAASRRERR